MDSIDYRPRIRSLACREHKISSVTVTACSVFKFAPISQVLFLSDYKKMVKYLLFTLGSNLT